MVIYILPFHTFSSTVLTKKQALPLLQRRPINNLPRKPPILLPPPHNPAPTDRHKPARHNHNNLQPQSLCPHRLRPSRRKQDLPPPSRDPCRQSRGGVESALLSLHGGEYVYRASWGGEWKKLPEVFPVVFTA